MYALAKLGIGIMGLWMLATQVPLAMVAVIHSTANVFSNLGGH